MKIIKMKIIKTRLIKNIKTNINNIKMKNKNLFYNKQKITTKIKKIKINMKINNLK